MKLDAEIVTMRHATPEPALVAWLGRNGRRINACLIAVPIITALYFAAQFARAVL